ncbi:MAG: group III truncated hemoglobin [Alphaproteobacteria bacterium]|nr:group III truncated hemoglobin [Alphaproteobacteria bacterium]
MTTQGQLNDESFAKLMALFYARVRKDPDLGPIFNDTIADWPHHLAKLSDFWHSLMLTSGRFKGNPMMKHLIHKARIKPAHFDRWLELWDAATNEVMAPEHASAMQLKARRISESFKLALFYKPDLVTPPKQEAKA